MENRVWWKESVVYQIYPRSFYDSNGDGIGDLPGIISKLDYIKSLGVDVIWLCPIFSSPNDDNGYDVSDYKEIQPEFGSMQDFENLLSKAHELGMKVILDLVANHSSDEHAWFKESRKSKDNPYRDYYYWRKGEGNSPPSNWPSFFGGSVWEYDKLTDEYYLHYFSKKQPDLNWENPKVREEIYDTIRFWFDKGVDGFRMDVITAISKDLSFQDVQTDDFHQIIGKHYTNGPRVHEFLKEMNEKVVSHYDVMTVGEGPGINTNNALQYVGKDRDELNMVFHFDHMFIDRDPQVKYRTKQWKLAEFKSIFSQWDRVLANKGWGSIFLGNHDFARILNRFGNPKEYRIESAKLLATLLMTMRGTPYVYQGDEIGMTNIKFESTAQFKDIEAINGLKDALSKGRTEEEYLAGINQLGRDNSRTPIQWSDDENAGFSVNEPWLEINSNYTEINVASQEKGEDSILNYYRKLIHLRKEHLTWVYGEYEDMLPQHEQLYVYKRWDDANQYLVVLNMSDEIVESPEFELKSAQLITTNYVNSNADKKLHPWEARVYRMG